MKYGNKVTHPKFLTLIPKGRRLQDSGFTLVELIVVITILAILGTIAFISLQGYSATSRDSVRISDTGNMKTTLELFNLNAGKYPLPDNYATAQYSGNNLFFQGTFGSNVIQSVSRNMNEVPTDPLTELEYIYSVSNNKNELEILSLMETDDFALNSISQTNAASLNVAPRINGNYNGLFIKTSTHIVPLPSIINTEATSGTLLPLDSENIKSMVTNKGKNVPNHGNVATLTGQLVGLELSVWTGSIAKDDIDADKAAVMQAIQAAYTGSVLATADIYEYVLSISGETELASLLDTVVLDGNTAVATSTTPIVTALIDQITCEGANWIWVDSTTDVYIGTTQGNGFCISPRYGDWNADSNLGNGGISWNGWGNQALDYYNGWNSSTIPVDDTGNPHPEYGQTKMLDSEVSYNCKAIGTAASDFDVSDTVAGRMKWLATTGNSYTEARSIDWITGLVPHTVGTNPHAIPALFIADCIDGVKDLGTTMTYTHNEDTTSDITYAQYTTDNIENTDLAYLSDTTYQDRQKYLTAWTQKKGSHLPSAMSHITTGYASATDAGGDFLTTTSRGEYQVACDAGKFGAVTYNGTTQYTGANDDIANERIWLSAVGDTTGTDRGRNARIVGYSGCGDQYNDGTGRRNGTKSARFVVRP